MPSRFKLLTLRTAWLIDQNPSDYAKVRKDIAAVKVKMAEVNDSVVSRSAARARKGPKSMLTGLALQVPS